MQGALDLRFKNNYHVELIDSTTGKIKQSGDFHNTHLIGFYQFLVGKSSYSDTESSAVGGYWNLGYRLYAGSGTTEPTFDNTGLAASLWSASPTSASYEWVDDYTLRKTASYTFGASSSYVGNVSEIGLRSQYTYRINSSTGGSSEAAFCTRSLLTDSEGQLITFNKTDIDILIITVTIEVSLQSLTEGFHIIRKCLFLERLLGKTEVSTSSVGYNGTFRTLNGSLQLIRFDHSRLAGNAIYDRQVGTAVTCTSKLTQDEAYVVYPVERLASTDVTAQTFYNAVALPTLCYWDLTKEGIFTPYSITGITIGTGDGATASFENPLNYFKANSDKVYKNGVQLTRGVDYTINNMGNKDCKPEVAQMSPIVAVKSNVNLTSYTLQVHPLIIPVSHGSTRYDGFKSANQYDTTKESPAFSNSNPLYIEYEEAVTMNCLKCTGGLKTISSPSGYNNISAGALFYIDYSLDGEEYIEVGSATTTATNGVFDMTFPDTTAKYWRVRTNLTSNVAMPRDDNNENFLTLNRKDPYIVFAEVPAAGDTLTMDVEMDLIMKNDNFVVDLSCRVDFSI